MARRNHRDNASGPAGPSQRALRAGELVRHAIAEILQRGDVHDPVLEGHLITIPEVRMSPDLRHATCFVEPLGAGVGAVHENTDEVIKALNRHAKFLRGVLGRHIDMKFTPDLRFRHDESFDAASRMDRLFNDPRVRADLEAQDDDGEE